MLLAKYASERPIELRADLQRVFGIDLDDVGRSVTVWQAAACAACLPLGSAVLASYDPRASWTPLEWRMREVACAVCGKVLPYPWELEGKAGPELASMPKDELLEALYGREWRECDGGFCI